MISFKIYDKKYHCFHQRLWYDLCTVHPATKGDDDDDANDEDGDDVNDDDSYEDIGDDDDDYSYDDGGDHSVVGK